MTRFAEDPMPAILLGLTALAIGGIVYLHTRKTGAFLALIAILLLTMAAVMAERMIVTEKERVESVIFGVAEAAEANDMQAVLAYIASQSSKIQRLVRREMPRCHIERARILSKLNMNLDASTTPPSAVVKFQGFISGTWGQNQVQFGQRSDITVTLEKQNDTWQILEATGIDR